VNSIGTKKEPFVLRRAMVEDALQLFGLLTELARFENLAPPDEGAKQHLLEDGFGHRKRFDVYWAFAAESEIAVGFYAILETYSIFMARARLRIKDLYVRPDFRRRGIGKTLIWLCLAEGHQRGYERNKAPRSKLRGIRRTICLRLSA
jgi:GNAT superfamily N-acetyltransferase